MSEAAEQSLFDKTRQELGFTDEQNTITLYDDQAEFPAPDTREYKIFDGDQQGNLTILVYGIDRTLIKYTKYGSGKTSSLNAKEVVLRATRLKEPKKRPDGSIQKYVFAKNQPNYPFFPPALCDKYENGTVIPVLFITEGYKKAFKGAMHGLDIVGLGSITHWRDKETGQLHGDIKKLIDKCKPQRVVFLADGDCMNLTNKDILENIDLYKRPASFFSSVNTFHDLLSDSAYQDIKKYFAYINTDEIDGKPKGLDDLYNSVPKGDESVITNAATDFGTKGEITNYQNHYFFKFDITITTHRVRTHFKIHSVDEFYSYHAERRADLKGKEFIFNGSRYKYSEQDGKCLIMVPSETKDYIRVETDFYKIVQKPSSDGTLNQTLVPWNRQAIREDIGKKKYEQFIDHVAKFNSFVIVPDHFNYQPHYNNCYNLYYPLPYVVEKGETGTDDDFPVSMDFIKHIFGTGTITWTDESTGKTETYKEWELGLDYLKILLCEPTHILPILCLVSNERMTGKTTFFDWLKEMFGSNMAFVGNEDLKNEFNKHWASKLLVACDETKIDKQEVVEKVKRLATARKSMMNSKGKDQTEQDIFVKFLFASNNEDNFLPADEREVRFWVRKIVPIKKTNVDIQKELREEIPAFLHFLKQRPLSTPRMERHHFHHELLKTEALKKLVKNSRSTLEKELSAKLQDLFDESGEAQITLDPKRIQELFFGGRYEINYIRQIVGDKMGYKMVEGLGGKYFKYPKVVVQPDTLEPSVQYVSCVGRYYTFKRADFCPDYVEVTDVTDKHRERAENKADEGEEWQDLYGTKK